MHVQPGQGIHGVREPVLAWLSHWVAARWQGNKGRRLHALRCRGMMGPTILAGVLGATWGGASDAVNLACGKVRVISCRHAW